MNATGEFKLPDARITFVTPTWRGDYERFLLQRESMVRLGILQRHLAIVNDEDRDLFERMPFNDNLEVKGLGDVLPAKICQRRGRRWYGRRDPRHWLLPSPISGWLIQQLAKLAAVDEVQTESYVSLDSDAFFIRKCKDADFYASDGRLHLYEGPSLDVENGFWQGQSCYFFKVLLRAGRLRNYVFAPVPLRCSVVRAMRSWIEETYRKPWLDAFLRENLQSEYMAYGVFASEVHKLEGLAPIEPELVLSYWWPEDLEGFSKTFVERALASPAKIVLLNSSCGIPVERYRKSVEEIWKATA